MYLTANDWGNLQNTNLTRDVFLTLVQRVKKIGMVSILEDVKAQALGLTLQLDGIQRHTTARSMASVLPGQGFCQAVHGNEGAVPSWIPGKLSRQPNGVR